jgi:uncharacterized protein
VNIIVDTGPLVALLNRRDHHHDWARSTAGGLDAPFHTCEAVLAEAHHLMRRIHDGNRRLNQLVDSGKLDLSFRYEGHRQRVHELIDKYANVPMSFTDACLVALSESLRDPRVFTVDADFRIYRQKRNRALSLLHPGQRG